MPSQGQYTLRWDLASERTYIFLNVEIDVLQRLKTFFNAFLLTGRRCIRKLRWNLIYSTGAVDVARVPYPVIAFIRPFEMFSVHLSFMHNCSISRNTLTLKCRALEFIAATQILPRPHWLWLLLRMKTRIPFPLMSVTFRNEAQCKNTRVPCFAYSFNSTPRYWN